MCACPVTWTAYQRLHALKAHGLRHQVGFISRWRLTSAMELVQWQKAVARLLYVTQPHTHTHTRIHKDTNSHFPCSPRSSSGFRSFFLFYISVTLLFLLCSSCHLPFHAPSQKCVQVNISCLLMLKGSGSSRYVTGWELSVPRAATDKTETLFFPCCFYLLNKEYAWLEGTIWR